MQDDTILSMAMGAIAKPFDSLKNGEVQGKVYRVLADQPVPVFDMPGPNSPVMMRLAPGSLLVAFSDPGEMRQINTSDQVFGYIHRAVKLVPVPALDPDGLYDPEKRAAVEATLPAVDGMGTAHAATQNRQKRSQVLFMIGFLALIVLGMLFVVTRPAPPAPDPGTQVKATK